MMKHFYLLLVLIGGLIAETAEAQHFSYTPPDNFSVDTANADGNTWLNESAGSVIQISITEGSSFAAFESSFNEQQLTDNNLVIKEKRIIKSCSENNIKHAAYIYVCSFRTVSADGGQDVEFTRIVYFTGNENLMIMAVATIPVLAEPVMLEPVIQSFEKSLIIL